jgi:hypothetical protein
MDALDPVGELAAKPPSRRRARPRGHRTAEQRDKLAASQFIELHSTCSSQGRFAGYQWAGISQRVLEH